MKVKETGGARGAEFGDSIQILDDAGNFIFQIDFTANAGGSGVAGVTVDALDYDQTQTTHQGRRAWFKCGVLQNV